METQSIITAIISVVFGGGLVGIYQAFFSGKKTISDVKIDTDRRWQELNEWQKNEFNTRVSKLELQVENLNKYIITLQNYIIENGLKIPKE